MPVRCKKKRKKENDVFSKMFKERYDEKWEKVPGETTGALSPQYINIADELQPFYQKEFPNIDFPSGKRYADKDFFPLDKFIYIGEDKKTGLEVWCSVLWLFRLCFYPGMICEVREI